MKETSIQTPDGHCAGSRCEACGTNFGRREALKTVAGVALVAGAAMHRLHAQEDGPRKGDFLVRTDDDSKTPLTVADVKVGEKPIIVFPLDPEAKKARDGSRLNRIVLVRLDPSTLDAATAARAAEGVVAYSAFCTHEGCDVNAWVAADKSLLCFCHFSKFAPHQEAAVTAGPAPRPLPALPIKAEDGKLVVAGGFSARPGRA